MRTTDVITTDVISTELGTHGGRRLEGRVERRTWRIPLGARVGIELTRLRPTAIVVHGAEESTLAIPRPPRPYALAALALAALWTAGQLAGWAARRRAARMEVRRGRA